MTAIELDQPIYGLRAAAWEGRAVGDTLQEVAADHVRYIVATAPTGPVILYGMDSGSLFAFEIARQLLALGKDVPLLVVSGSPGPALPLVPSRARLGDLVHSLAALPFRELPQALIRLGIGKGRQLNQRIAFSKANASNPDPSRCVRVDEDPGCLGALCSAVVPLPAGIAL